MDLGKYHREILKASLKAADLAESAGVKLMNLQAPSDFDSALLQAELTKDVLLAASKVRDEAESSNPHDYYSPILELTKTAIVRTKEAEEFLEQGAPK